MEKTKALDSSFVSVLLTALFGEDVLKESSARGGKSNFNKTSHKALDANKLTFIKGFFLNKKNEFLKKLNLHIFYRSF